MAGLRTEFSFTLPKGYVGADGVLHRDGTMRLATARDEIEPLRDRSIEGPDDPYLTILVLARVITELGSLESIGTDQVEGLFAADLAFLQDLYGIINFGDQNDVDSLQASVLPASSNEPDLPDLPDLDDAVGVEEDVPDLDVGDESSGAPTARGRGRIEEVTQRTGTS